MEEELDKILNSKSGFKYHAIDAKSHIRLLHFSHDNRGPVVNYKLEIVSLSDLSRTVYRALSYTWGHAHIIDDIREIQIDGQTLFIRRNLYDFLTTAAAKGEYGLWFVDAICINQLDHDERQSQIQHMASVFHNANEVISWLGLLSANQFDNVRALSQSKSKDCVVWTTAQWEGFRYLSYHRYWSRIWVVQEVLLASSVTVWCSFFTFPLNIFMGVPHTLPPPKTKIAENGRPSTVVSASARLRSPAETIITHRLRQVIRPRKDPLAQGTKVGTLEEMVKELKEPSSVAETYQSHIPDRLCKVVRKFGRHGCSDPRDRLYGLLGILNERTRARVKPDYTKDVNYAYYQALKIGLQELYFEHGAVVFPNQGNIDDTYLGYYCDVRDAFGMADEESIVILRQVLSELRFHIRLQNALSEVQWQQQFEWRDAEVRLLPDFKQLLALAEGECPEAEGPLFKFHKRQSRICESLLTWLRSGSRK